MLKIMTWNVNGLRAVLNRNGFDWVKDYQPDVLCLQEIKSAPHQLTPEAMQPFEGYQAHWHPAQKLGYSGVLTLARQPLSEVNFGLGIPQFDAEGRMLWHRLDNFWLFNGYFPNGQRDQGRLDYKLDFYARLLEMVDRLHTAGEQVVICGDFNTAHREIDLRNPKQNATTSGFLPEERAWLDTYVEHGLVDAFRQLYPEKVQYTWWTYVTNARQRDVGWRLDFFMASQALMPRVKDVVIHNEIYGSDHCPVTLVIE